jgi:hypothetical protein
MPFVGHDEIEIGQPVEPTHRGLNRHDQYWRVMVAIETGTDDPVRNTSPGELGGGLMHQFATMDEDSDTSSLADNPADDAGEDHRLAGAGR